MKRQEAQKLVLRLGSEQTTIQSEQKKPSDAHLTSDKESASNIVPSVDIAMELGYSIVIPIVGGAFLGVYLDKRFGIAPKLTLLFIFLGLGLGIYNAYRLLKNTYHS